MDTHISAPRRTGVFLSACLLLLAAFRVVAQPQPLAVTTVAGTANFGNADGVAPAAKFLFTAGVTVDNAGNVYVADTLNDTIRKISASGVVTTLAGTAQVAGSNNGTGSAALFNQPYGVAVDGAGNVYVADTGNSVIRRIATNGVVTTVAGQSGTNGYLDGGTNFATFNHPYGLAVDAATNIYVADTTDNLIRKIAGSTVSTIAGDNNTNRLHLGTNFGNIDGTNFNARFTTPLAIAVDKSTNLYVADYGNNTIRRVSPSGTNWIVTTLAGKTNAVGTLNGVGTNASFDAPTGIAVDSFTNIYVADETNDLIRLISFTNSGWAVTTLAGVTNSDGTPLFGDADGLSLDASFNGPWGIAVDSAANVYIGDSGNGNIREIAPDTNLALNVSTIAGPVASASLVDSMNPAQARFNYPNGVALDGAANMYVADSLNNCIRQITPSGAVTVLAGSVSGFSGTNDGQNNNATFNFPTGLCVDANTNIFVADFDNSTVREISPVFNGTFTNWVTTTIAGQPQTLGYFDNANPSNALFNGTAAVAIDTTGNVYVADLGNNSIRIITNSGGGVGTYAGTNDNFNSPAGVAWDATTGDIYVADTGNGQIVQVDTGGNLKFLTNVGFPMGVAVDANGAVYAADSFDNTILEVPPGFKQTQLKNIAGTNGLTGSANGLNMAAQFDQPIGMAVDSSGNVYIADALNNTIRKGAPVLTGVSAVLTADTSPSGLGVTVNGIGYTSTPQTIPLPLSGSVTTSAAQTMVSSTALATNAFVFANWISNGVTATSSTNYTFALTGNTTIVANYVPQYTIALSASPGIDGSVGGAGTFASNTAVTVTATANAGFVFANWTQGGIVMSTTTNYTFTLTGDVTLVANFIPAYPVTVSASPSNGGTTSASATIVSNTVITVSATNAAGFIFTNWTSNSIVVSSNTTYTFTVTTNVALVANFLPLFADNVSVSPGGSGTASLGGTNVIGSMITVNATNSSGFVFTNWTSNGISVASTTSFTFTIVTNVTLVANFLPLFTASVVAKPTGTGTVSPSTTNISGSTVTVIATNAPGFVFTNWTSNGLSVATTTNFSFTIVTNVNMAAHFLPLFNYTVAASPGADGTVSPGATNIVTGTVITVTATNNPGFVFTNWTSNGISVSGSTNYTFTLDTNVALVANFLPLFAYNVSASPPGDGSVSAGGTNVIGSVITVSATNNPTFIFNNWTSNGVVVSTATNFTFTIVTNVNLVGNFLSTYTTTLTASPPGGGTFNANGTFISNTLVTVTATNNPGYTFTGWNSNNVSVTSNMTFSFNIVTNVALTANFTLTPANIAIDAGGTTLTNNQTNAFSFGVTQINQPDPIVSFTVSNLGGLPLTVSNISIPPEFVLTNTAATLTNFPATIPGLTNAPVTNGVFSVALTTSNLGAYSGTIVVTNNNTNFSFPIAGVVSSPAPVIRLLDGLTTISNGQTQAVSFGSIPMNQAGLTQIFTITNPGLLPLNISNVTIPAGYTLTASPPAIIGATNSATFIVRLNTTNSGIFGGNISLANNDTNNNPFVFPITGQVTVKIISLSGNLAFGVVPIGTSPTLTLTISNAGNTNLTVSNITYPPGYSGAFAGVIPPNSSHAVSATFTPTSAASFAGAITVASDATGGIGTIPVSGFGANGSSLNLVVITNGAGTVAPILTSKPLVAGKKYTLNATARTGSVFSNWSGSITTNKSSLTFVMEPGTILEATFIPNPFLPTKGTYNGLFTATNGNVTEDTAGMLKGLTIGTKGTYSGTLMINGSGHGLSGTFNLAGQATNKITRPAAQGGNLLVFLNLLTPSNSTPFVTGTIFGTNSGGPWVSTNLVADLASNVPFSSEYTLTIPPDTNNSLSNSIPGGDGYALITNHVGAVKITGALADGTAFSESVPVSQSGDVPIFASLYANKGLLLGWINLDASNAPGTLSWVHSGARTGFTTTFTTTNTIALSGWTNPPAGTSLPKNLVVLDLANGAVTQSNAFVITVSNNFKIGAVSGPLPLSGSFNPKTGQMTLTIGSKTDKQTANGVVLLNGTNGGGFFVTKTNSGAIILKP